MKNDDAYRGGGDRPRNEPRKTARPVRTAVVVGVVRLGFSLARRIVEAIPPEQWPTIGEVFTHLPR